MKRTLFLAVLLALAMLLNGCGGATAVGTDESLADIRDEMIVLLGEDDPIRLSNEYLYILYGLEEADFAEAAAFMISRNIFSDEIILVKAKDEDALGRLKALLEEHLATIREQSKDYDPASFEIVKHSKVETDGLYAWLLISSKQEEMGKLFAQHRKSYPADSVPVYTPLPTAEPTPAPTAAPTAEPTPVSDSAEPTAEPTPEPTPLPYGRVPEGAPVADEWWDDVLFFGNSVAKNLETYVTKQRMGSWPGCMGKASFLTIGSYTYQDAATGSGATPVFRGTPCRVEEAVAMANAKKVFISLGQGDIIFFQRSIEETMGYVDTFVTSIQAANPDTTVYLMGMSPRARVFEVQEQNNALLRRFNETLCQYAQEHGCYFVDSHEALADADGCLPEEYCSETYDGGIHLTDAGCAAWLDYIYRHTGA